MTHGPHGEKSPGDRGTRGIGRAAVEEFLVAGAQVPVNGSSAASVAAALAGLKDRERAVAAPSDLREVAGCQLVVEGAVAALGGLDVLMNNAGVGRPGLKFEDTTAEQWDATVNVNLRAGFFCARYAVPALRAAKGNVVNLASVLGLGGRGTGLSLYCASKGGVVNLTRACFRRWAARWGATMWRPAMQSSHRAGP